jgi:acetyl esterase
MLLDGLAQAGGPPLHEMSPAEAREVFRGLIAFDQPEEVTRVDDRLIPADGTDVPVRVYTPADAVGGNAPLLIWIHGGGWVIGDLDTHDVQCRQITAEGGITVVAVDYRLAPEHKFPAAVDDAWAATRWVVAHAGELGVDPRRIAVSGDSAGGNLAAVVALLARDAGNTPAIALQVLVYPVTDLAGESKSYGDFSDGYLLTRDSMRWFKNHYLKSSSDTDDWRASPLRAPSLAGLPPALVITAGFDPLRDEGAAYATRMTEAGGRVDYVCYGGMIHGFMPMGRLIDTGNRAISHVAASLRQALR